MKIPIIHTLVLLALLSFHLLSRGQVNYPTGYFRSPVGFTMLLSGNFGELRENHFHSGIDIKTKKVEGKPVYAVADGYVSRINISSIGFGRALYIAHPNGYTSVYAHLKGFNDTITAFVKKEQYKRESYTFDILLPTGLIPVKKSDLIALAGNSGASQGPHLHFELRNDTTQAPIDPVLFGLEIMDYIRPKIKKINVYPMSPETVINDTNVETTYEVDGWGMGHYLRNADTLHICGKVIFGIMAFDLMNGTLSENGVNTIELYVDSVMVFSQVLRKFEFSETRYINALIDYPEYNRSRQLFQRSYIQPNCNIPIFGKCKNRGVVNFKDTLFHRVTYIVKDSKLNASACSFVVKSYCTDTLKRIKPDPPDCDVFFPCRQENRFVKNDVILRLPEGVLYDDLYFRYDVLPPPSNVISKVHQLHDESVPLHTYCDLSIKPHHLSEKLRNKAVIVRLYGKYRINCGGEWEKGFITTRIRDFGKYAVAIDTVPPRIFPVNIKKFKKIKSLRTIFIKVTDNLTGIKSYYPTLNGKWIPMEYDVKKKMLIYQVDENMVSGKNEFRLIVKDEKDNTSGFRATLIR